MTKYWKANAATSKRIIELVAGWDRIVRDANKLAKKHGAKGVYTSHGFVRFYVSGFAFRKEARVDTKAFVRLKGTSDGWRPRASTPLGRQLSGMRSDFMFEICKIIGMQWLHGISVRMPGVKVVKKTVFLQLPDDVKPEGCRRMSDLAYERATL